MTKAHNLVTTHVDSTLFIAEVHCYYHKATAQKPIIEAIPALTTADKKIINYCWLTTILHKLWMLEGGQFMQDIPIIR